MAYKIRFLFVLALFIAVNNAWSQDDLSNKEKKDIKQQERLAQMTELVNDKSIEFVADRAFSTGWSSVDLTTNSNYLRVFNDSAFTDMPFFGRSYQHTLGESGGIQFDNKVKERKITVNEKKGKISVSFKVIGKNDVFQCQLDIFDFESASLTIISNNLQAISYNGKITEWITEKEKKK